MAITKFGCYLVTLQYYDGERGCSVRQQKYFYGWQDCLDFCDREHHVLTSCTDDDKYASYQMPEYSIKRVYLKKTKFFEIFPLLYNVYKSKGYV